MLSALHFNENSSRDQATTVTASGEERFEVLYPKYKKGGHIVRKILLDQATVCYHFLNQLQHICDRIWENPPHGIFCEKLVCNIYHKIYLRRNHCPSLRPVARFDFKIQRFVFSRARILEIEKLLSKGVATYA